MTSHDTTARKASLIALALLLSPACTEPPAEDPCVASEELRTCSDNVDALVDLSQVATLQALGAGYELEGEGYQVPSYYGALYLSSAATDTVNIELKALADDGTETCPSVSGDVAPGERKWIGIGAETTSISVSVDGEDVGTIGDFDPTAGSTVSLQCQDTGEIEYEIMPVNERGPSSSGEVRRNYVTLMSCDQGPCVNVDNANGARVGAMRVLYAVPAAGSSTSADTCSDQRSYDWLNTGETVPPGESRTLIVDPAALALGFIHDGDAPESFDGEQGVNFVELVDPSSSLVRFEKVPGCTSDEQELPVAVPFVATRSDAAPPEAPTCEFASGCTWVEFRNCTDSGGTVTPWVGADEPVSIAAGATVAIPIDAGGVRQEAWQWETGDDPTVIIRKKKGCDM